MGVVLLVQVIVATALYFTAGYLIDRNRAVQAVNSHVVEQRSALQTSALFNFRLRVILEESPVNPFAFDMWRSNFSYHVETWKKRQQEFADIHAKFDRFGNYAASSDAKRLFLELNKLSEKVLNKVIVLSGMPLETLTSETNRADNPVALHPMELMQVIQNTNELMRELEEMSDYNADLLLLLTAVASVVTILMLVLIAVFVMRPAVKRLSSAIVQEESIRNMLEQMATTDPLTGIGNRTALDDYITSTVKTAFAEGRHIAFVTVDLDGFKPINDRYGHDAGDAVLKEIAFRLSAETGEDDIVVRYGGDEFALVFSDVGSLKSAHETGKKLVAAFKEPVTYGTDELFVGASIGIAVTGTKPKKFDDLISHSDQAMYEIKERRAGTTYRVVDFETATGAAPEEQECSAA